MGEFDELPLINLLSIVLMGLIAAAPSSPIRTALGLLFALFFPGYVMIAALYPRRDDLNGAERVAFSFGLSLAVGPLIGMILNFLPWGTSVRPLLASFSAFILICSLLAARARRQLTHEERFSVAIIPLLTRVRGLPWPEVAVPVLAACCIVIVGWRLHGANPPGRENFTEFYLLGAASKAEDYPDRLLLGDSTRVILGIIDHELRQETYKITIEEGGQVLASFGPIQLDDGQKWQQKIEFRPTELGDRVKIEFLLFKNDDTVPYRRLHLWLAVLPR